MGQSEHPHTLSFHLILNQAFEKALKALKEQQGLLRPVFLPLQVGDAQSFPAPPVPSPAADSKGALGMDASASEQSDGVKTLLCLSPWLCPQLTFPCPRAPGLGESPSSHLSSRVPQDGAVIRNYSARSRGTRSNKHLDLLWTCCCSHPTQPSLITVLPHSLCRLWVKDVPVPCWGSQWIPRHGPGNGTPGWKCRLVLKELMEHDQTTALLLSGCFRGSLRG